MGAKTPFIELSNGSLIPILYEDRSVIAIDKPPGWMLVPFSWQKTDRNLQAAITSSIAARNFWARSRNLKHLQHVHRLDADTTGVLLFAKSRGAVQTYGDLFEARKVGKVYLAVVQGIPNRSEWLCQLPIAPDPEKHGKMRIDHKDGKESETEFRRLNQLTPPGQPPRALIEARPITGRTHQIRVHLAQSGYPVIGDALYGESKTDRFQAVKSESFPMALRSVFLAYTDPFTKRQVRVEAPWKVFVQHHGFPIPEDWKPSAQVLQRF